MQTLTGWINSIYLFVLIFDVFKHLNLSLNRDETLKIFETETRLRLVFQILRDQEVTKF